MSPLGKYQATCTPAGSHAKGPGLQLAHCELAFTVCSIVMFPIHLPYCLRAFSKTILNIANLSHIFPNISRMPTAPWINIDMADIIKNIPITNPKPNR